jgi:hypothetical protein
MYSRVCNTLTAAHAFRHCHSCNTYKQTNSLAACCTLPPLPSYYRCNCTQYAYVCTGFACLADILLFTLLLWRGARADAALRLRYQRRASTAAVANGPQRLDIEAGRVRRTSVETRGVLGKGLPVTAKPVTVKSVTANAVTADKSATGKSEPVGAAKRGSSSDSVPTVGPTVSTEKVTRLKEGSLSPPTTAARRASAEQQSLVDSSTTSSSFPAT